MAEGPPQVWGFALKKDGIPYSCPHIGIVLDYDWAIRSKQSKLLNATHDFQRALEDAIADSDLRLLSFTSPFTCQASSHDCHALSAPGLGDMFPLMQQRGTKR